MAKKLEALKSRIMVWRANYDEASDQRHRSLGRDRDHCEMRLLELREEAQTIETELAALTGDSALVVRRAFQFLVRNVCELDRAPREIAEICREVAAA